MTSPKVAVLGGGAMGGAFALALARGGVKVGVSHAKKSWSQAFKAAGVEEGTNESLLTSGSPDFVVLAVKPWMIPSVAAECAAWLQGRPCLSLAARVTLEDLQKALPGCPVARAMPNLAVAHGKGCTAFAGGTWPEEGRQRAMELLRAGGTVLETDERGLTVVGALTGSGVAFALELLQSFIQAGLSLGLPATQALEAGLTAFEGAAALVREEKSHPAALRDRVCTPGGTTIAGLRVMNDLGLVESLSRVLEETYRANKTS